MNPVPQPKEGQPNPARSRVNQLDAEPGERDAATRKLKTRDIARKISSFDHFIYLWGDKAKYYLPPKRCLSWHYISQILSREKRLLKLDQVGHVLEVPKVRGKVVRDMWNKCKETNGLSLYFPDVHVTQFIPRDYFFNVPSPGPESRSARKLSGVHRRAQPRGQAQSHSPERPRHPDLAGSRAAPFRAARGRCPVSES